MTHAIRVHAYGGPEVLKWEEVEVGPPGPGEVRIKQTAVGLNYIDVYSRTGYYPQPSLPFVPGMEGAGVVTAVGEGVKDLKVGMRVAYAGPDRRLCRRAADRGGSGGQAAVRYKRRDRCLDHAQGHDRAISPAADL